ncbi:MAG: N-6 DNA methylase [Acidimicrobiales bacterium]|nr:N-6 DNA methylase [Acidimicrobiales bacterium]
MGAEDRAVALARVASGLASGAGVELPAGLWLWRLAGGRPRAEAQPSADPAADLGAALERTLTDRQRRRGAHYTPAPLAERIAALALPRPAPLPVVDPACGAGALLLAVGRRLVDAGVPAVAVARDLLWGCDIDPIAAATTEAAIALWSGGTAPGPGHLVAADALRSGAAAWPDPPATGFGAVVANPPFQGQLAAATARPAAEQAALRARFGDAMSAYADSAALFLLLGIELCRPGGRVAMVQPTSTASSRDAGATRRAVADRARLVDLVVPDAATFAANVHVCLPVLEVGEPDPDPSWSLRLAGARGVPRVVVAVHRTVGDLAGAVGGFRQHYYGLVGHVHEARSDDVAALVTSGLIDVGASHWGRRPVRFARAIWERPAVDLPGVARDAPAVGAWLERLRRPKVLVATQTRVTEAAADRTGTWVPCTPVVSVVPHDPADVDRLAAVLCAPPVAAWAVGRMGGSGLSAAAIRTSTALALAAPLPPDRGAWEDASAALVAGELDRFAERATAMYRLDRDDAAAVLTWWHGARPANRVLGPAQAAR